MLLPNYADIPALLAEHRVEIVASLPYFQGRETDAQRGDGVFEESIESQRRPYNPAAAASVMCRNTLSVGWDGVLYDCDFNQMLDLPVDASVPWTIFDADRTLLEGRSIVVGPHCFGCTAGAGSSCGGAVA